MDNIVSAFSKIREELCDHSHPVHADSDCFGTLFLAAAVKSLDFNVCVHEETNTDGVLYQPFLRGVTEDLIYLCFLKQLDSLTRTKLLDALHAREFFEAVFKQRVFFEQQRPEQPVYLAQFHGWDDVKELQDAKDELNTLWERILGGDRPTIRNLAARAGLLDVYDYLYAATSRTVHFNPHSLLRLGWAEVPSLCRDRSDGKQTFKFSLSHFSHYYREFTKFYATFLFVRLYDSFPDKFPTSESIIRHVDIIREYLGQPTRWPEMITFEEMNVVLEDGVHFFEFIRNPFATTLLKGLPKRFVANDDGNV